MKTTTRRIGNSLHCGTAINKSWSRSGALPKSVKLKECQRKERLKKKWWFKILQRIFDIKI